MGHGEGINRAHGMAHRSLDVGTMPGTGGCVLSKLRISDAVGRLAGALDHVFPWRIGLGFALSYNKC